MKKCSRCGTIKPNSDFYTDLRTITELYSECKGCTLLSCKERFDRKSFGGMRKSVLKRDKCRCIKCFMTDKEHKDRWKLEITIDHIDGNRKNNRLNNLQTLCLKCHGTKDQRRRIYA